MMAMYTELSRRQQAGTVVLVLCLSGSALAQEIFRTQDENGVVGFSDVASTNAERLVITNPPVPADAMANQQRIIDQQLAVAKVLEESRLAREDARTRRLEALAAAQPRTVYYREPERTRYVGGIYSRSSYRHRRWGYGPGNGKPTHPGVRPPHPSLPIVRPPGHGHGRSSKQPGMSVSLPPLKSWKG